MNGFVLWLRRTGDRMRSALQRFMAGRYGQVDKLNSHLLWLGVIFVVVSMFLPTGPLTLALPLLAYVQLGVVLWRMLSRNVRRRARENRRYLTSMERLRDREHRYFVCPKCHQDVRVPKDKGKIAITCPQCHEKFIKKT